MSAEPIAFRPRWREEIEAITPEGKLVFEFGVGDGYEVYFPDAARWQEKAPPWAQAHWQRYVDECKAWCGKNGVRFSLTADAHFQEEK